MYRLVKELRHIKARFFLFTALQSLHRSVIVQIGLALLGSFTTVSAQSVPVTVGYRDFSYGSTPAPEITGEKPQSKLWWNDGYWWGSLWANSSQRYRIHRFDEATQSWINTGTAIDDRGSTKADALWDGQRLYIVSGILTSNAGPASPSNSARLYRYSYNSTSKTYTLDSGFPVIVNGSESETLVIDKDSTGQLWITWVENGKVKVNRSLNNDLTWGTPFDLPVQGANVSYDDISSVIAFDGNKIGILWSNQDDLKTYFAVHLDNSSDEVWQPREEAMADANLGAVSDDHINLKVSGDGNGNIYAASKTSLNGSDAPEVIVLKRTPAGVWSYYVFGTRGDHHTRPLLMIDRENQKVYVFARSTQTGPGIMYMKSADLNNIQFPPGLGTPFIQSETDDNVNNPTSTKQSVDGTTGLLVLASDRNSRYYLHNHIDLSGKPDIHFFTPTSGLVGSEVTISGIHFNGVTAVAFHGSAASFIVDSSTQIRATVPAGATTGIISIANSHGTASSANDFTVILQPSVTTFAPSSGPEGTEVTITGNNFTGATEVAFNGSPVFDFTFDSNTQLRANVPAGATTGKIKVTNAAGTGLSTNNFTVIHPPIITSFTPGNGPVGTEVTVNGTNFVGVTAAKINGSTATSFFVDSSTRLRVLVPAGTSTGKINITNADGTGSSATNFVVTQVPVVTSFTPSSGPVGTQVTITGNNFIGITEVAFNGTIAASFTVNSSTEIRVEVPFAATTGKISVTNSAGAGFSTSNFTVTPPPIIISFLPSGGAVGTVVTITGSYFSSVTQIAFNGTAVTSFTIDSDTQLRATVPTGATTGKISVTNPIGTDVSADNFIVTATPVITAFTPNNGPVGTEVTITGGNFTGVTQVRFNGTTASFVIDSNSQLRAVVPANATTGKIGMTNANGTSASADDFIVTLLPSITSFSPNEGPPGAEVTITGSKFTGVTSVAFNGTPALNFILVGDTQLRATVPAGATTGQISLTNSAGTGFSAAVFTVTLPLSFSFTPSHDAYVKQSEPTENYGSGSTLRLQNGSDVDKSYLKFVVTGLNGTVMSAKLRLYVNNPSNDGGSVYAVSNNYQNTTTAWAEAGLIWNNAPAISGTPLSAAGAVALDTWIELDVTAAILTSGDNTYSFALVNNSSDRTYYSSKEGANAPKLVIDTFVDPPVLPTISSFFPADGPTGTQVTLTGTNLGGVTAVAFNGISATTFSVDSPTQIRAIVPAAATTGKISVTAPAGTALSATNFTVTTSSNFSFTATHDAYTRLSSPAQSYSSTPALLQRATTDEAINTYVKFVAGGLGWPIVSAKLRLYVTNASDDGGSVYLVSNNYQGAIEEWTEDGLNWNNAPVIGGSALSSAGPVSINSWIELEVTAAILGNGAYSFGLKNISSDVVNYSSKEGGHAPELIIQTGSSSPAGPAISSFTPTSGSAGTEVTLTGTNLGGVTAVAFNSISATTFSVDSPTQIRALVPAAATTGKISVTAPAGTALSATNFTVTASSNFSFTATHDAYTRLSSPAQSYSSTPALLQRVTPGEAINTYVKFVASGLGWPIVSAKLRLYVTNASDDGGSVYVVSNNYQGAAEEWTEGGLNWNNAPVIGGSALSSAGPVSINSWIELEVTAAIFGNGTYSFGLKNISSDVVNYSSKEGGHSPELIIQTGSSSPPGPAISSFTPTSGSTGTEVTITGTNLGGVTAVAFNSISATTFSVDSPTQIRANVPAAATTGKISVTAPAGTALSATDFTITASSTFTPSHDAYVRLSSPAQNFGATAGLLQRVMANEVINTYLKFAISGISGTMQSATFRLYVTNASDDGGAVYSVSNKFEGLTLDWTEGSLTWSNAPAIGPAGSALSSTGAVSVENWIEFDVTAAIAGNGIYSFALKNSSSDMVSYSSKEGGNPPQLVIQTSGGSSSAPKQAESGMQYAGLDQLEQTEDLSSLRLTLHPNHPNPFNAQTIIEYTLPLASSVQLVIYNVYGQTVRRLVQNQQPAGHYRAVWDGKDERGSAVSSGIYYYRLKADSEIRLGQMTMVK